MSEHLTVEEQLALSRTMRALNEKGWGIGLGLVSAMGLFVATNVLILKGGSSVGSHLQLLHLYFPGYRVSFVGSLIGFVYAFVLGYGVGRTVVGLYHRAAAWLD
jgi:hypothetical protein